MRAIFSQRSGSLRLICQCHINIFYLMYPTCKYRALKTESELFEKCKSTVTSRWMPLSCYTPLENVGPLQKPMQMTTWTNKAMETTRHVFHSRKRAMWTFYLTLKRYDRISYLKNWKQKSDKISHNGYLRNSEYNGRIKNGGHHIGFFVAMVTISEKQKFKIREFLRQNSSVF